MFIRELEMIKEFPALNGPYADEISDNPKQTDYCIGKSVIYSAFNWSPSRDAYHAVFELARKHGVGFYDVSGVEGQVWVPDSKGGYACIHAGREPLTPEEAAEDRARIRESFEEFVLEIKTHYQEVRINKPPTSRKTSAEVYIIAQNRQDSNLSLYDTESLLKDE